jgi:hypothetical protein
MSTEARREYYKNINTEKPESDVIDHLAGVRFENTEPPSYNSTATPLSPAPEVIKLI